MKKIFILVIITILFTGCGGEGNGGGGSSTGEPADKDVTMELNKAYTVYPGNKLIKDSTSAKISITHNDGRSTSTVILLTGNASIIRKP